MSRFSSQRSYAHGIQRVDRVTYIISWAVDRYYGGSRLRYPRVYRRVANEFGARRFAKRHGIEMLQE